MIAFLLSQKENCVLLWTFSFYLRLLKCTFNVATRSKLALYGRWFASLPKHPASKYKLRDHNFTIPRFNTVSFRQHSLRYMSTEVCRSVPSNVKGACSLSSFKYNIIIVYLSIAQTALSAVLNLIWLCLGYICTYCNYIVLPNFFFAHTVYSFFP